MPSALIYFEEEEDKIIRKYSAEWNLSKIETVRKIISKFKGDEKDAV